MLALQQRAGNRAVSGALSELRSLTLSLGSLAGTVDAMFGGHQGFKFRCLILTAYRHTDILANRARVVEIRAATARLKARTRAIERTLDHANGHPGPRGHEELLVLCTAAGGELDEIELTDTVFLARHPERREEPLDPKASRDRRLVREWIQVRRRIVQPTLRGPLARYLLNI